MPYSDNITLAVTTQYNFFMLCTGKPSETASFVIHCKKELSLES